MKEGLLPDLRFVDRQKSPWMVAADIKATPSEIDPSQATKVDETLLLPSDKQSSKTRLAPGEFNDLIQMESTSGQRSTLAA